MTEQIIKQLRGNVRQYVLCMVKNTAEIEVLIELLDEINQLIYRRLVKYLMNTPQVNKAVDSVSHAIRELRMQVMTQYSPHMRIGSALISHDDWQQARMDAFKDIAEKFFGDEIVRRHPALWHVAELCNALSYLINEGKYPTGVNTDWVIVLEKLIQNPKLLRKIILNCRCDDDKKEGLCND